MVLPVNHPTGFDYGVKILRWEKDEGDGSVRSDRIGGEEAELGQIVERDNADARRDSCYVDYGNAPVTVAKWAEGTVDRMEINRELHLYVWLSKSNISGGSPEFQCYQPSQLEL